MYQRLLVPVDGSSTSLKGLEEALKLQKSGGGRVKVVHVVNELILDSNFAPSLYYEQLILSLREAGARVLADATAYARAQHVEIESELIETIGARASNIILEAARQWQADLIVMGTHGRRGLRRLALGSDAEGVLRLSPVPVLVVRDSAV